MSELENTLDHNTSPHSTHIYTRPENITTRYNNIYRAECVDMKTVSAGLLLGRAGDPSSCDRLPGSSQLWLVELAPITHLTAVIRPRIFSLGSQILCDSRQCVEVAAQNVIIVIV